MNGRETAGLSLRRKDGILLLWERIPTLRGTHGRRRRLRLKCLIGGKGFCSSPQLLLFG